MKLVIDIEQTDLIQNLTENVHNDDIMDFILDLDASLENEDFTIDLILNLLESLGIDAKEIDVIKGYLGFDGKEQP